MALSSPTVTYILRFCGSDDIDLIEIDCRTVPKAVDPLKRETMRVGSTKTKYKRVKTDVDEVVKEGDVSEVVEEFGHLRTLVTCNM